MHQCPICRQEVRWEDNPFRPFCSERCQIQDLGAWASENYRVPEDDTQRTSLGEADFERPV